MRMPGSGGKIGHAELQIGDSRIMLADEHPELGVKGPGAYGGSTSTCSRLVASSSGSVGSPIVTGPTPCQSKKLLVSPRTRVLEETLEILGGGGVIAACGLPW